VGIQAECVNWLQALPDSLRATVMTEALEAIADLDLTALAEVTATRLRPVLITMKRRTRSQVWSNRALPLDPSTIVMT
jgi:hypothetical protein